MKRAWWWISDHWKWIPWLGMLVIVEGILLKADPMATLQLNGYYLAIGFLIGAQWAVDGCLKERSGPFPYRPIDSVWAMLAWPMVVLIMVAVILDPDDTSLSLIVTS